MSTTPRLPKPDHAAAPADVLSEPRSSVGSLGVRVRHVALPRGDVDAEELRGSREFAELRAQVSHAVKAAAAA